MSASRSTRDVPLRGSPMIGSLRIADIGIRRSVLLRAPRIGDAPGLTWSDSGAGSIVSGRRIPELQPSRAFWFSGWEDDDALDAFEASGHPILETFSAGWASRLLPERVYEKNSSLFGPIDGSSDTAEPGPLLVVTMSTARLRTLPRFQRASLPVEREVTTAPGMLWTMGFAKPPRRFATVTFWASAADIVRFAHGRSTGGSHRDAIEQGDAHDFFSRSLVLRSRLYRVEGALHAEPRLTAETLTGS